MNKLGIRSDFSKYFALFEIEEPGFGELQIRKII